MPIAVIPDIMDDGSEATPSSSFSYPMGDDEEGAGDHSPQQAYFVDAWGRPVVRYGGSERESIKCEREREGRCGDCGVQTHEMQIDPLTRTQVKVPLTVEGEVHRGRCLLCYPIFPPRFLSSLTATPLVHPSSPSSLTKTALSPGVDSCGDTTRTSAAEILRGGTATATRASAPPPSQSPTSSRGTTRTSRRVSSQMSFHNPTDPSVQSALTLLQGYTFDIVDIISAMKQFSHDRVVQERGCERLWVLSWEDENSAAIGRVGGIPVILDAMARFPMNAHLQQCACECLQNLAHVNDYNRREICDWNGVQLIVQAMMRHMDCAGIQQCGCTALASIAAGSQDLIREIMGSGGFHAILIAAQHFADEESVLRAAYDGLTAMGYDPAGRLPPLCLSYVSS
jgi:hypothetical protein